jgi:glycosyltransferase involved in cell wall biosynthesis
MRVAFHTPSWPHGQNGIISYTRTVSRALHDLGVDVLILTFDANGSLGFETIVPLAEPRPSLVARLAAGVARRLMLAHQLPTIDPKALAIAAALQDLRSRDKVDLFEMEETFGWCGLVADRTVVPVVARLHGPYFLNGVYEVAPGAALDPHRLRSEGESITKAGAVTSPSRQVLDATRAYYNLKREACVVPNPIAIGEADGLWSLDACDRDAVLFVGRTDSRKGGDLVIRAFVELASSRPQLRLHFVGPHSGFIDSTPGESISDYLARSVPPEVRKKIIVHGPLRSGDIAKLRLAARVTIVASRYENFPMAALEVLAVGGPIVATAVGGIPEIVVDCETGLLCDPEVEGDLASKVARLLDDDALSVRIGRAGRQSCIDRFHPTIVARKMLEVYSALLGRAKT